MNRLYSFYHPFLQRKRKSRSMSNPRSIAVYYAEIFGIPALIFGLIGNFLNIYIFLSVRSYRRSPSAFYLLISVISNLVHLSCAMTTRILSISFNIDSTQTSIIWCKTRQFLIGTYPPLALTCQSLAAIDQFLITSRNVRVRQWSSMKIAHRMVVCCVGFWHLHSLPFLFYNRIQMNRCVITNQNLLIYWSSIHFFVVLMAIPTLTLATFGYLGYRNMKRLTDNGQMIGSDRQFITMICLQLILVIVATIPYGVYNTYLLITFNRIKTVEQLDGDFLFLTITSLVSLFNFGVSLNLYVEIN